MRLIQIRSESAWVNIVRSGILLLTDQYYTVYNIIEIKALKGGMTVAFGLGAQLLDACVLAVLNRGDTYGYELTQSLKRVVDLSESTLYPVLRRLQKEGYLIAYDQPYQGRNRRYYAITDAGRAAYRAYLAQWAQYKDKIDKLLSGGTVE